MKILVLKIEAPMASFGDVAVNETRPTGLHPMKSMIAGLLANALGYKREEPDDIQYLQDGLLLATRIDREPKLLVDYQTAFKTAKQVCPKTGMISFLHKENVWSTRPIEMGTFKDGTMQLYKHYLTDVAYTAAISHSSENLVMECADAVKNPHRPLFLGRKGTLPSRPLFEDLTEANFLVNAFHQYPVNDENGGGYLIRTEANEKKCLGPQSSLIEVYDIKNWKTDIHSVKRPVAEGRVRIGDVS